MTDFLYTYRYDLSQSDSTITRLLIVRLPQPCRTVPEVTYDWQQGTLLVDAAKALVGFLSMEVIFSDGIRFQLLNELYPQFLCFDLTSTDGLPLSKSLRALLMLTADTPVFVVELWG
jgi:hypothetical protein